MKTTDSSYPIISMQAYERNQGWRKPKNAARHSNTTIPGKMCHQYWNMLIIAEKEKALEEFLKKWEIVQGKK